MPSWMQNLLHNLGDEQRKNNPAGVVANGARLLHGLIPFLHHEPPALLLAEIELRDSRGFRRLCVRCLDVTKVLGAAAENRDAPRAQLGGGGLLFHSRGHAR
jgi:hypothetical protein